MKRIRHILPPQRLNLSCVQSRFWMYSPRTLFRSSATIDSKTISTVRLSRRLEKQRQSRRSGHARCLTQINDVCQRRSMITSIYDIIGAKKHNKLSLITSLVHCMRSALALFLYQATGLTIDYTTIARSAYTYLLSRRCETSKSGSRQWNRTSDGSTIGQLIRTRDRGVQ